MKTEPVFIVGVPRSGTTLLAAMLAAHSQISCGPETHFFRKLSHVNVEQLIAQETWPVPAVNFICSIRDDTFSSYEREISLLQKYELHRDQIDAFLRGKKPSVADMLSSVTEQSMIVQGKTRWAEKTPDHIRFLADVRKHFPKAPIIRIIRDPRDVALSLTKVPWGALSYLDALLLWKRWDDMSDGFFQTDNLSYTLRYEDVISCPEEELTKLCRFIGEDFEPEMLDTSKTGKQMNSRNVPWMDKASQSIDASHRAIWKERLTDEDNYLAEAILGDRLTILGYPKEAKFLHRGEIYPSFSLVTKFPDAIKALTSTGVRFWKNGEEDKNQIVKIYLGDPSNDNWLIGNRIQHIKIAFSILIEIIKARLSGQSVYWISDSELESWTGYVAYFLNKVLLPYKYPLNET